ncbi:MAG: type I DNA topoisomerase [Bacillota bacterium]|nr:type I DNA topoisomerase [Bacillota bacterium]
MPQTLVIVESPAKAKTIGRYLGDDYRLAASVGHIRDLPSGTLGVNVNNRYKPLYINMRGKEKVIRELKELGKLYEDILIATDPDREGEAIAWHIATLLRIDPASPCRITFNEITARAVREAVADPRPIDMDLVNAQQARRILDRLVGYELSPVLWAKIRRGLSAGRVQSVATRMIVDREDEIRAFVPEEYWVITATLETAAAERFTARYQGSLGADGKLQREKPANEEAAMAVVNDVRGQTFTVHDIRRGQRRRQPQAPFTTSTLQQEASRRLGFTAQRSMRVAQQLYEGIDLAGQGPTALVTYIRTDSVRVSQEAVTAARAHIEERYGREYLPASPRSYRNRNASQDAHEAIRPAHFELDPESLKSQLSNEQYRLYRLIWERFIASQMKPAEFATLVVDTVAAARLFRTNGETITFPGFLRVYEDLPARRDEAEAADDDEDPRQLIPALTAGEKLTERGIRPEQKFTRPPARYTEASLIKALEEAGIGRPSTYAPTISTIQQRRYVEKERQYLLPTELGELVTRMLQEHFSDIVDISFTANMEEQLDTVEGGDADWVEVLDRFYPSFHEAVEEAKVNIEKVEMPIVETGELCPKCQKPLQIKTGRYGRFIACSGFPDCTFTKNIDVEAPGRCPKCGSGLFERKTRRNARYYVCDQKGEDPDCDFRSWDLPLADRHCPTCGSYMVEKRFRGRSYERCSNRDCPTNERNKKKADTAE